MPTTSIRTATKARLKELLSEHEALRSVDVDYGFPGKRLRLEHVWIALITGDVTYELVMAGRKIRTDDFTITVVFRVEIKGGSLEQAEERVEEMFAALEDVLADDQTFEDLDGVLMALLGPTVEDISELSADGAIAVKTADVTVKARYD